MPGPGQLKLEFFDCFTADLVSNNCWEWLGSIGQNGYGLFCSKQGELREYAHRYVYRILVGPIGFDLHVLHHCDNRKCIRPSHLFQGTHADNMKDARQKGRIGACPKSLEVLLKRQQQRQEAVVCKRGHALSGPNLYLCHLKNGRTMRVCRSCRDMRWKEYRVCQN